MNPPMTILRSDYLEILEDLITPDVIADLQQQKCRITRSTKFCAAKLIQIFERFTRWKQEAYRKLGCWFWIPIVKSAPAHDDDQGVCVDVAEESTPFRSLYHELQGEHCKDVIRSALKLLESLPILDRKNNPHNGQDRTYWYRLDLAALEALAAQREAARSEKKRLKALREAIDYISPLQGDPPPSEGGISPTISKINSEPFLKQSIAVALKSDQEDRNEDRSRDRPLDQAQPHLANRLVQPRLSDGDLISSEAVAALAELKIEINSTILREIKAHPDRLLDAIAVVRQEVAKRWVVNPSGVFMNASRRGQKPKREVTGQNGSDRVFVAPVTEPETDLLTKYWSILQAKITLHDERGIKDSLDRLIAQKQSPIVHQLISWLRARGSAWAIVEGKAVKHRIEEVGE